MVLNANAFLRAAYSGGPLHPYAYCHRPIVVADPGTLLGKALSRLSVHPESDVNDVIDEDLILIWSEVKQVITGSDILGRLLRGIALRDVAGHRA